MRTYLLISVVALAGCSQPCATVNHGFTDYTLNPGVQNEIEEGQSCWANADVKVDGHLFVYAGDRAARWMVSQIDIKGNGTGLFHAGRTTADTGALDIPFNEVIRADGQGKIKIELSYATSSCEPPCATDMLTIDASSVLKFSK